MADLKFSQFTPATSTADVHLVGYANNDNVRIEPGTFVSSESFDILNDKVDSVESDIEYIQEIIPNTASSTNQLVDRDTMNSSITSMAANYVTYTANGDAFPTLNDLLSATIFYHGGVTYSPTSKDYATILSDPTAPAPFTNGTVRRTYDGAVWAYSYGINEQPLTADQVAALGSGITASKVSQYDLYETEKQDTLIAGENISILDNVISSSGGGSGGDYLDKRTFINVIRGTVGRNAHLINNFTYFILKDGIIRGYNNPGNFSLASDSDVRTVKIANITYKKDDICGLRYVVNTGYAPGYNFICGFGYEHLSVTISGSGNLSAIGGKFMSENPGLEYISIGINIAPPAGMTKIFCDLPNLDTIILTGAPTNQLNLLDPNISFINVKNTPECVLYGLNAQTIIDRFPGLSNWTAKELGVPL